MYRDVADYSVLESVALWLARAVLNPSRRVRCTHMRYQYNLSSFRLARLVTF